ncbi:MAG: replication factor C large subunit [Candidatus Aenigmarchaeota archaeon]|nr:replication factor C large subunit [Candidatus Aenigmarchaeota archaeon]
MLTSRLNIVNMFWSKKYSPEKVSEIVGQNKPVEQFLLWYRNWKPGKKAALLVGGPGVGKTCLVEAFAKTKNLELIEMNASDKRTSSQIKESIGQSMKQQSLFKRGKIFLIDEVDGLSGRSDRGGTGEIVKIIKESHFPVVLTANDQWGSKLSGIKSNSKVIKFGKVHLWSMIKRLQVICEKEDVKCHKKILKQLAKMSEGDMRSAINDLESIARGKKVVSLRDLDDLSNRERSEDIFETLKIIFKTKSLMAARRSVSDVDKRPDEIFWWIEQNIANEYEKIEEISNAYEMLSRADIFRGRISRRQYWTLLKYMIDLMSGGVALSKKEMYRKFSRYQYPDKIKYLGRTKVKRAKEMEQLLEISERLHCSTKKIRQEYLPYFRLEELVD